MYTIANEVVTIIHSVVCCHTFVGVPMILAGAVAGGVVVVVLFVAIATTLILVAVLLGRKKFCQTSNRKLGKSLLYCS